MNFISEFPNEDTANFFEEISNFFEDIMYDWGGSPLLGRIFSLCVLTPQKVLQKDLVERFNVNPSTISRNLTELESRKLIERRRDPGSREWKYQAEETSFFELVAHKFEETSVSIRERSDGLLRIRNHWSEVFKDTKKASEKEQYALKVLDQLHDWFKVVEVELDSFISRLHEKFLDFERK